MTSTNNELATGTSWTDTTSNEQAPIHLNKQKGTLMLNTKKPNFNLYELPLFFWSIQQPVNDYLESEKILAQKHGISLAMARVIFELNYGGSND